MGKKTMGVKMNLPTTPEGWDAFRRAMAEANTTLLVGALNKMDAPVEQKRAYIRSLNGHAPWGHTHRRDSNAKEVGVFGGT